MAKLGEIFNLQMGKTPARSNDAYWNGGQYNWISIADLGTYHKYTSKTKEQITELAVQESGIKKVPKNTVIMSFKLSLGKTAITSEEIYTNEAIMAFIPKKNYEIYPDYFYYFFSGRDWSKSTNRAVMGTTLNKATLSEIDIEIPSMDKQHLIVKKMDLLCRLIEFRKHQLEKLDELVKSRFIEMFGDLYANRMGYDILSIDDVCSLIKDGTHQTPVYTEDSQTGFKFLSSKDVMTGKICWENIKYIPEELHKKLYATLQPQKQDILMSKNGVNYGVAAVNDTDEIFDIYVSLALLRPKLDKVNPIYFKAVINNQDTKYQFDNSIKGIGVPNLHLGEIKKTRILVPPLDLQNQFADFVAQVDKSKLAVQKSLEQLEILKKALMQEYFG